MGWIGFQSDKIFIQRDENNYLQFKERKPHDVELTNQTEVIAPKEFRDFSVKKIYYSKPTKHKFQQFQLFCVATSR